MHHPRPGRLATFSYTGRHRYSVTICAKRPLEPFRDPTTVSEVLQHLRHFAAAEQFALLAYCFMPDHVHVLVQGLSETSGLCRLIVRWKQGTGYCFKQRTGVTLWMSGYYDRVLRDGDPTLEAVQYVLSNPVREGLARRICEFPFSGSDVFTVEELEEVLKQG